MFLSSRAPFFEFSKNFSENLVFGNATMFRAPLTCPFFGRALDTIIQDAEMDAFTQLWTPSPADSGNLFAHEDIQSGIYYGGKAEASRLGFLAGKQIKMLKSFSGVEDVVLITANSDLTSAIEQITSSKKGFLQNEFEHSMKIFVHEDVFEQAKALLQEQFAQMYSPEMDFSFDTKKLLLLSNLTEFAEKDTLPTSGDLADSLKLFSRTSKDIQDPLGEHAAGSQELFQAQYELETLQKTGTQRTRLIPEWENQRVAPALLEQSASSRLLQSALDGPVVTLTRFSDIGEVEYVLDRIGTFKRLTVFSEKEDDVKSAIQRLSCNRINVNSFEECSYSNLLNSINQVGIDHLVNMQTILDR